MCGYFDWSIFASLVVRDALHRLVEASAGPRSGAEGDLRVLYRRGGQIQSYLSHAEQSETSTDRLLPGISGRCNTWLADGKISPRQGNF